MTVFDQLKKDALYAQRSYSTELLYQAHGAAEMARQLGAITHDEAMELNTMTVVFMNTNRDYIRHQGEEFRRLAGAVVPQARQECTIPAEMLEYTRKALDDLAIRQEMQAEKIGPLDTAADELLKQAAETRKAANFYHERYMAYRFPEVCGDSADSSGRR